MLDVGTTRGVAYGPLLAHRADVHLPDDDAAPLLVHLHGGGLEGGAPGDLDGVASRLVAAGVGVVAATYRLYPDARYPEFVEDAAACVAWALRTFPGRAVVVGGSSAGAYLAAMLALDPRWLAAHDLTPAAVAGWVLDAGQPTTHFAVLTERGEDPRRVVVDEAAPLFHVGARATLEPTLVVLAEDDIPGRAEQTAVLLAALRAFGLDDAVRHEVLDGYQHSAYLGDDRPEGQDRFAALVAAHVHACAGPGAGSVGGRG